MDSGVEGTKIDKNEALVPRTDRDAIKRIALDIGKQVAFHIETMYPDAVRAASSSFLLSVRNCTSNEIMAAIESNLTFSDRLERNDQHRRKIRRLKKCTTVEDVKQEMRTR